MVRVSEAPEDASYGRNKYDTDRVRSDTGLSQKLPPSASRTADRVWRKNDCLSYALAFSCILLNWKKKTLLKHFLVIRSLEFEAFCSRRGNRHYHFLRIGLANYFAWRWGRSSSHSLLGERIVLQLELERQTKRIYRTSTSCTWRRHFNK